MRRLIVASLACTLALAAAPVLAQDANPLKVSGSVDGKLEAGETVTLHINVTHQGGYRKIDEIQVALRANDRDIEAIVLEPVIFGVSIPGTGTASLLDAKPLEGAFFSVVGERIRLESQGKRMRVTMPVKLLRDPPEGARLAVSAIAGLAKAGPANIGEPTTHRGAISWAGILLAAAVALFVGAAFGASVGSRRKAAPSVYDSVKRKLDEPSPGPGPGAEAAPPTPARTPAATRKPATRKPATRKPATRKPATRKPATRKPAAKKAAAGKAAPRKATPTKATAKRSSAKKASTARRRPSGSGRGGRTT